jgi:type 1 fimbriae regulatory protein FimB/type 1 fimbriae regulatory protein FimE
MSKSARKMVSTEIASTTENVTVERRPYLTPEEVERLATAARVRGRYGHRDATMILLAYRHGLRVSELVTLRWDQIDLKIGRIHINRLKGSESGPHPLSGVELRALRRVHKEDGEGPFVFMTERQAPMSSSGFFKMLRRTAEWIGLRGVHPHILRHACGYKLVNDGVDTRTIAAYLGHRNLQNTSRYTAMSATRFNGLWKD